MSTEQNKTLTLGSLFEVPGVLNWEGCLQESSRSGTVKLNHSQFV